MWHISSLARCASFSTGPICLSLRACREEDFEGIPDGIAVLAGLAVQETQLFERLAENVFAAHFVLVYLLELWRVRLHSESSGLEQMVSQWSVRASCSQPVVLSPAPPPARQKLSAVLNNLNSIRFRRDTISPHPLISPLQTTHLSTPLRELAQYVRPLRYQGVPRPNARPPGQHQHALRPASHLPERRREPQQHRGSRQGG
jgi:hypothetical protein